MTNAPCRYVTDLKRGLRFEAHVARLFADHMKLKLENWPNAGPRERGENPQGVEIKLDERFRQTGNLFIEYEERSNLASAWHNAGIVEPGRHVWALAIGDYESVYVFGIRPLCYLFAEGGHKYVETATSKGFLLPLADAERHALFFLPPPLRGPFSLRER